MDEFSVPAKKLIPPEDLPEDWADLSDEEKRQFINQYHDSAE